MNLSLWMVLSQHSCTSPSQKSNSACFLWWVLGGKEFSALPGGMRIFLRFGTESWAQGFYPSLSLSLSLYVSPINSTWILGKGIFPSSLRVADTFLFLPLPLSRGFSMAIPFPHELSGVHRRGEDRGNGFCLFHSCGPSSPTWAHAHGRGDTVGGSWLSLDPILAHIF